MFDCLRSRKQANCHVFRKTEEQSVLNLNVEAVNSGELTAGILATGQQTKAEVIVEFVVKFRKLLDANGGAASKYAALGIPQAESVGPTTTTVPVATVDTSERLRHTIRWADSATPSSKRRPRGTIGIEIWRKIDGPLSGSELDCEFLALDTETHTSSNTPQNTPAKPSTT